MFPIIRDISCLRGAIVYFRISSISPVGLASSISSILRKCQLSQSSFKMSRMIRRIANRDRSSGESSCGGAAS
jgi:hypothetical protein